MHNTHTHTHTHTQHTQQTQDFRWWYGYLRAAEHGTAQWRLARLRRLFVDRPWGPRPTKPEGLGGGSSSGAATAWWCAGSHGFAIGGSGVILRSRAAVTVAPPKKPKGDPDAFPPRPRVALILGASGVLRWVPPALADAAVPTAITTSAQEDSGSGAATGGALEKVVVLRLRDEDAALALAAAAVGPGVDESAASSVVAPWGIVLVQAGAAARDDGNDDDGDDGDDAVAALAKLKCPPAEVVDVLAGSPAAAAGVEAGWRVEAVGAEPALGAADAMALLAATLASALAAYSSAQGGAPAAAASLPGRAAAVGGAVGVQTELAGLGAGPQECRVVFRTQRLRDLVEADPALRAAAAACGPNGESTLPIDAPAELFCCSSSAQALTSLACLARGDKEREL